MERVGLLFLGMMRLFLPSPFQARNCVCVLFAVADVLLWKEWKTSLAIAASVTLLWFAFEISSFTIVTLIADLLMVAISVTFVWAQVASFLNK